MDSVEVVPAEQEIQPGGLRSSTRLRRRPTYFTPGGCAEPAPEDDVKFFATVTSSKGIKDFAESVNFRGTSGWRLNQILRRLSRGLKVDPKFKYVWTIWSEEKQSEGYIEWEKLASLIQLKTKDACKLRLYKQRKQPPPAKKPEVKEVPKPAKTPAPVAKPTPPPPSTPPFPPQYAAVSPQDMMMSMYLASMYYNYPWMYYQMPYQ